MPIVKRYGQPQVAATALPGVRKTQTDTYASLGGGVGEAIAGLGHQVTTIGLEGFAHIQKVERDRADDLAELQIVRRFNELSHRLLRSEEQGLLHKKGLQPHELRDQYLGEFDTEAGAIGTDLRSTRQRLFYEKQKIQHRDQFRASVDVHAVREMDAYETQEFNATIASSLNAAIAAGSDLGQGKNNELQLRHIGAELAYQEEAIAKHGARLGMSPAAQEALRNEFRAKVHVGVIGQILATPGNHEVARAYFEETRDAIGLGDADALAEIQKAVNAGVLLGRAQQASDQIMATHKTPAEQRAAAKAIADPQQREQTLRLVEHEIGVKQDLDRQDHDAMTLRGLNIIEKTRKLSSIPRTEWERYTVQERRALELYLEEKATGGVKTNPNVYAYLIGLRDSDDPAERAAFRNINPVALAGSLSPSDFQEVTRAIGAARTGDREAAEKLLVNASAQTAMVNEALVAMGLPTNPAEPGAKAHDAVQYARISQFRRAVREAAARLEQAPGRTRGPVTDTELQSIIDQLRTKTGQRVRPRPIASPTFRPPSGAGSRRRCGSRARRSPMPRSCGSST
jgi:hypothetical protein